MHLLHGTNFGFKVPLDIQDVQRTFKNTISVPAHESSLYKHVRAGPTHVQYLQATLRRYLFGHRCGSVGFTVAWLSGGPVFMRRMRVGGGRFHRPSAGSAWVCSVCARVSNCAAVLRSDFQGVQVGRRADPRAAPGAFHRKRFHGRFETRRMPSHLTEMLFLYRRAGPTDDR